MIVSEFVLCTCSPTGYVPVVWRAFFISKANFKLQEENCMEFFNSAVGVLQVLVVALGAGLGIWGAINLLEGYGNDNPGANAHVR